MAAAAARTEQRNGQRSERPAATVDIEAERLVIGAALVAGVDGRDIYAEVDGPSLTEAFADGYHQQIWSLIGALHEQGAPVNLETVARLAMEKGFHNGLAGDLSTWAVRVSDYWGAPSLALTYAQRVLAAATRRRLHTEAVTLAEEAKTNHKPITDWLPSRLNDLLSIQLANGKREGLSALVGDVLDDVEHSRRFGAAVIPTGLRAVDDIIGGWWVGEVHVEAGRASMGKTASMLTAVGNACAAGTPTAVITCEMSPEQIVKRLLSHEAGVGVARIVRGWLNVQETVALAAAGSRIADWPLTIEQPREYTWPTLALSLRRLAVNGCKLVFVDYLGLLSYPAHGLSRWEQIGRMTADAVRLAKELKIALVLLCQLNREVGKEKDKRPSLFHLREGGSIEQDAAVVLLLHRPGYYDQLVPSDRAECIVAKNRHGPTGTVSLRWHGETAQFVDDDRTAI